MTVARILETKGYLVSTITKNLTLGDAAKLLAEQRIGVLVVTADDGAIEGILSERDIVRAVGLHGGAVLSQDVAKYMTERVMTCTADTSVLDVMEMMTAGRFRHLPVIRQNRLDGIISITDVVKRRLQEMELDQQAMRNYINQVA